MSGGRSAAWPRRLALIFLTIASLAMLGAFVLPGWRGGELLFVALAAAFPVALMVLGAGRGGRLGPVAPALLLLLLVLEGTLLGMWGLRGRVEDGPWLFGLPLAAALQLFGLFLLPLFIVSLGYARTFEGWALRDEDLADLRRRFPGPPQGEP